MYVYFILMRAIAAIDYANRVVESIIKYIYPAAACMGYFRGEYLFVNGIIRI